MFRSHLDQIINTKHELITELKVVRRRFGEAICALLSFAGIYIKILT